MESVLALARTDGFGVCCSHLISMLQILNEVFTEPFVLQSAAPHIRGQLGAVPDMPIWHPSPAIYLELGAPTSGPLLEGSSKCAYTALWCPAQRGAEEPERRTPGTRGRQTLELSLSAWRQLGRRQLERHILIRTCSCSVPWSTAVVPRLSTLGRTSSSSVSPASLSRWTHVYWASTMPLVFSRTDIY